MSQMKVAAKAFSSLPKESYIAGLTLLAIAGHLILRYAAASPPRIALLPLFGALIIGGIPLVSELAKKLFKMEFGSDLLAGVSILTAVLLAQYLVATIVVLMLSGGAALEFYATAKACSVLDELAKRVPSIAHRREGSVLHDVKLEEIRVGDLLTVFPHEICPVDGEVLEGHGVMDEAYLTGEPYEISKTPGSKVISGAINEEQALTIRAEKLAVDSRYARIMRVMHETEQQKPRIRRLGDRLGAWYTPLALAVAGVAGFLSADAPYRHSGAIFKAPPGCGHRARRKTREPRAAARGSRQRAPRRGASRHHRRPKGSNHWPRQSRFGATSSAAPGGGLGMFGLHRRPLCGGAALSRHAAQGQPHFHRASAPASRRAQGDAGLRRPGIGGEIPGGNCGNHRSTRGRESRGKSGNRQARNSARQNLVRGRRYQRRASSARRDGGRGVRLSQRHRRGSRGCRRA